MHALSLLQSGVGNIHRAHHRLVAAGRVGPEVDHDRGIRRQGRTLQVDGRERQRAGERSQRVVHEQATDIVLCQQCIHDFAGDLRALAGDIDKVGASVRSNHDIRLCRIGTDQPVAAPGVTAGSDR